VLGSYLTISVRHLGRRWAYTATNTVGLAVGVGFCVLVGGYVHSELSYDAWHMRGDRIYRVYQVWQRGYGGERFYPRLPALLGPALEHDFPQVEASVRMRDLETVVRSEGVAQREKVVFADPTLLDIFSFPLSVAGTGRELLGASSVVVSRAMATKYFGDEDPHGKRISVKLGEAFKDFEVSALVEPLPGNSTVGFKMLLTFAHMPGWDRHAEMWGASNTLTYVLLEEGCSPGTVEGQLPGFVDRHYQQAIEKFQEYGTLRPGPDPVQVGLQTLGEVHLDPKMRGGLTPATRPGTLYALSAIGLAVLVLACVNYVNLSMALYEKRSREVGIRKAMGARGPEIVVQLLCESAMLVFGAIVAGAGLAEAFSPAFSNLLSTRMRLVWGLPRVVALAALGLMVLVGAGLYPAVVVSRRNPRRAAEARTTRGSSGLLNKGLIAFQLATSVFLGCCSGMVLRQVRYLEDAGPGYDDKELLVVDASNLSEDRRGRLLDLYRDELLQYPSIGGVTAISEHLGVHHTGTTLRHNDRAIEARFYLVGPDFLETLGIVLAEGRDFRNLSDADRKASMVVNEAMVRELGWTSGVGESIRGRRTIVGVTRDFHYRSLHHPVEPLVLRLGSPSKLRFVIVRATPGAIRDALQRMEEKWEAFAPELPFVYSSLDRDLWGEYARERRWRAITWYTSGMSLLIACLGALGLTALAVGNRTREIGIRKVLGASVSGLVGLLSRDYVVLAGVASLGSFPVAYAVMQRWLAGFAYRAELGAGVFLWSGVVVLGAVGVAVASQTLRAALADPVASIADE